MNYKRDKTGFATLEIIIAMAIVVMAFVASDIVAFGNQSILTDSEQSQTALIKAELLLETAQTLAQEDFKSIGSLATTSTDGIYTDTLTFTDVDWFAKIATAHVTWQDGMQDGIIVRNITLTARLSDFDNTSESDTCDQNLSGDWTHPHVINTVTDFATLASDSSSDDAALYPITSIDAYEGKLYISASNETASTSTSTETFFMFNISDPKHPTLIAKLDNDKNKTGIEAVTVASTSLGAYAYAASESSFSRGQLQIFNLNMMPPTIIETYKIPTSTVSTSGIGRSIFYLDGYVYLGLTAATGPEFNIIDVHNPTNPIWVGGYDVGNDVNAIYVKGGYAYIATPNTRQLLILNIHNPNHPIAVGGFQMTGGIGGNGKSIYQIGSTLYFGETYATTHPELYILDNSNHTILLPMLTSDKINSSVNGLVVRSNLAAFITTAGQVEFDNVASSTDITQYAPAINLPNASSGTAMDCEGNYLYVGSVDAQNKSYLSIITSS